MLKRHSLQTGDCSTCIQKDTLLHKYQTLIKLYKIKGVKTSRGSQSSISCPITDQDLTIQTAKTLQIFGLLESLVKRRQSPLFKIHKQRTGKKLALLTIERKMKQKILKYSFSCLGNQSNLPSKETQSTKENQNDTARSSTIISGSQQYKDCQGIELISPQCRINQIKKGLTHLRGSIINKDLDSINVVQLSVINNKLQAEVKYLRDCLQESTRRQQKQNQKKQDSLCNLADDLQEKNQIIIELEKALKSYENKYQRNNNNVLNDENDPILLRSEIEHLESVGDKLNNELTKQRDKIQKYDLVIREQVSKIEKLEAQNLSLKRYQLNYKQNQKEILQQKEHLQNLIVKLSRKLKKISVFEKQLESGQQQPQSFQQFTDLIKSELILSFLANINFERYQLKCPDLFDQEQREFLLQHKNNHIKLVHEADRFNKSHFFEEFSKIDDIEVKGITNDENMAEHSLFSVIEKPKRDTMGAVLSDRQGVTMKILELEIEKSKKVQKISELKEILMHVRVLFKNLMKSLQLQQSSLKVDTEGVLRVIFEMFEYSEQQRQEMFPPKKKLFGFI